MQQELTETGINVDCVAKLSVCIVPMRLLRPVAFLNLLHLTGSKSDTSPNAFNETARVAEHPEGIRAHLN